MIETFDKDTFIVLVTLGPSRVLGAIRSVADAVVKTVQGVVDSVVSLVSSKF